MMYKEKKTETICSIPTNGNISLNKQLSSYWLILWYQDMY